MYRLWFAVIVLIALCAPASAQVQPIAPIQPLGPVAGPAAATPIQPLPPLVPFTPTQSLLNQTYRALQIAGSSNATLAARTAYARAISLYRSGDPAGAAAYAGWALAQLPGSSPTVIPPLPPLSPARTGAASSNVDQSFIGNGAVLPGYIAHARDAVLDARIDSRTRDRALAAVRNAIDAWLNGNAARARSEAHVAEQLAAGKAVL